MHANGIDPLRAFEPDGKRLLLSLSKAFDGCVRRGCVMDPVRYERLASLVLVTFLSGCTLPASGPRGSDINFEATTALTAQSGEANKFVLLDVAARTEANIEDAGLSSIYKRFGASMVRARPTRLTFSRGDVLQATIFESQSGGLFIDTAAGTRQGNFVQVPPQVVDTTGVIKVPYAGNIRVAGRSAESVQAEIESKLAHRAIQPQAIVSVVTQRGSEISVLGDVNAASKFSLNPNGERILDAISRAGGIKSPGYETYVTLQRRGQSVRVPFDSLVSSPQENVYVQPGDVIYVSRSPRSYTVLGATGQQSRVPFPDERLTLSEAIGASGGLVDSRANPGFVFLYRAEPRNLLTRLGVDLSNFDPSLTHIPTIYKSDLQRPSSMFSARKFEIRDKDVIYVADSDTLEVVKFFQVISAITQPVGQTATSAWAIRRAGAF